MILTVMTAGDKIVTVEVEPNELVEGVKALIEVETGIPLGSQSLLFNGNVLGNNQRLSDCGVADSDLLYVIDQGGGPLTGNGASGPRGTAPGAAAGAGLDDGSMAQNEDGSAANPEAFRRRLLSTLGMLDRLRQANPRLAEALQSGDVEEMQKALRWQREMRKETERKAQEERDLLMADPMDPEVQAKIEEKIRQENIDSNFEVALEHNPEQFVAVHMLYVEMIVNKHPIKAFIDSGAQQTIMSLQCAERCGLMRLLDRRFHGVAMGVGTGKIVGIIHSAPLQIGPSFYTCRISVLENLNMDFLFGLDMLRRHQCCLDLQANVLRLGNGETKVQVPFLDEKDVPKRDMSEIAEQAAAELAKSAAAGASASASVPVGTTPPAPLQQQRIKPVSTPSPSSTAASGHPAGASALSQAAASFEAKVGKLMELGFAREQCSAALLTAGGNEEHAAGLLFEGM